VTSANNTTMKHGTEKTMSNKNKRYNPERRVWRGISYRAGTSGHNGTRINEIRRKFWEKADDVFDPDEWEELFEFSDVKTVP
jgi:hypothetical protein